MELCILLLFSFVPLQCLLKDFHGVLHCDRIFTARISYFMGLVGYVTMGKRVRGVLRGNYGDINKVFYQTSSVQDLGARTFLVQGKVLQLGFYSNQSIHQLEMN